MIWRSIIVAGCLVLTGCASSKNVSEQAQKANNENTPEVDTSVSDPRDPLESFNRVMWSFNWDILDKYLVRPVAVSYRENVPSFIRRGVHNAALNLEEPASTVNNLLQGEMQGMAVSLGRFTINTTIGLLGTIDVAREMGIERRPEDFGEVLGRWGSGTGPYIMLPALGPHDVRTTLGRVVDNAYFPLADLNIYFSVLQNGVKLLETRADLVAQEDQLYNSLDPYAFVKDAYFQRLQNKVNNGVEQKQSEEEVELNEELDAYLENID
ncbi:MlaA family lipoprotein [Alteromonas sp. a30]|uniref:MlaA family lipoprotein n=1 Tax=Alteromonas sp. a30 TaxID=2730917 RepID=UPI00227ED363|nr:VacJ family lipoprotein [Alteromonas sp. a30]MCY7294396.1 VacJ family lipoprotein [Alteromonas sp. a30]